MKIRWKNWSIDHQKKYKSRKHSSMQNMGVKALCDRDLYCWSWFSRRCDTKNDLTLINLSPHFTEILREFCFLIIPTPYRLHKCAASRQMRYVLVDLLHPE